MIILFSGSLIDGDAKHERDLVLANAILVYELNDFLINYIERFEIDGLDQLSSIEAEMKSKISSLREEQQSLQKRAKGEGITDDRVRMQILQNVKNRLNAI